MSAFQNPKPRFSPLFLILVFHAIFIWIPWANATSIPMPESGSVINTGTIIVGVGETIDWGVEITGDATVINYGTIDNIVLYDSALIENYGTIGYISARDNARLFNYDTIDNMRLFSGNTDTVALDNYGFIESIDADVFSPANNGFIYIDNEGTISLCDLFDNVPVAPPTAVPEDYIRYSASGDTGVLHANTAGAGAIDIILLSSATINKIYLTGGATLYDYRGSDVAPVPEPSAFALLGIGLMSLLYGIIRRSKA